MVGVSCMLIDRSMHTIFTLYLGYIGLPYIVCVNMPEIVYTNVIKCQYYMPSIQLFTVKL